MITAPLNFYRFAACLDQVWVCIISGLIQGSAGILSGGYAMIMVSTFGRAQAAAIRKGYNDDLDTYIFISSEITMH